MYKIVTHTGIKNFKCDVCEKAFSDKANLTRHSATHTGIKNFKCDVCEKAFCLKSHLTAHVATHTGIKNFKCDICGKAFSDKGNLIRHSATHTGIKNFKCEVCEKAFARKGSLTMHMLTHTGIKNFKCDICEKAFAQKINLTYHMVTHTGIRDFKCEICQKAFAEKRRLTNHMATHTGIRNFKCDICEKAFVQKINLTNHMATHTKKSSILRKLLNRKNSPKTHRASHITKGTFLECGHCEEPFSREALLAKHIETHLEINQFHQTSESNLEESLTPIHPIDIKQEVRPKEEPGVNDLFEAKYHIVEGPTPFLDSVHIGSHLEINRLYQTSESSRQASLTPTHPIDIKRGVKEDPGDLFEAKYNIVEEQTPYLVSIASETASPQTKIKIEDLDETEDVKSENNEEVSADFF